MVSLPSPTSDGQFYSPRIEDEVDVSHVPLNRSRGSLSGVASMTNSPGAYGSNSSLPGLRTGHFDTFAEETAHSSDNLLGMRSPPTSSRGYNPFNRSPSVSYEPVGNTRRPSKKGVPRRNGSTLGFGHSAIPEHDEYDMGLLPGAAGMGLGGQSTAYRSIASEERAEEPFSPIEGNFDMSAFDGPMYRVAAQYHNAPNLTETQRLERKGTLTGGLGRGMNEPVTTTITATDLVASYSPTSPTAAPGLTRRMSRAISFRTIGINRAVNLRNMAQTEANRRGKPLRVVVEDEFANDNANVDLSAAEGGTAPAPVADLTMDFDPGSVSRSRTVGTAREIVVHPQANWKPFSMTWPYLCALIIISLGLAASTEILLQKSHREALFTFTSAENLSTWNYFMFKYLPTICAVSFGVLWQVTDFEVKRLEAYYQLSKPGGALAAESINVDYITFFNFLRPIRALRYKHYAVATSSVATLMAVSLVPSLQAACIQLLPGREVRDEKSGKLVPTKEIRINTVFSRILTCTLAVIAILGCLLLWQLSRRRSGLINDVKGVAGIAAMANRSHILMDFKNMDTALPDEIHKKLKSHRYVLQSSSLAPDTTTILTQKEKDKYDATIEKKHNPHPFMLRLVAGVPFLIGILLFMAFIPVVLFQQNANILTVKAPWLMTLLAVCVKLSWGTLETDVRMIEPFYILSNRYAKPEVLTLDYTAMVFGWMPIRAFANGHFLVGAVGVGSVLAEVLTVCASSFVNVNGTIYVKELFGHETSKEEGDINDGKETVNSFWVSFILALCILLFLFSVAVAVYIRRRHPFLPRQPNTISSVLAFIHQSKMLRDFAGTENLNNDEMVKRLAQVNKTYGLGWFAGRDGELHCGIDEEELHSNYRHGHNTRAATMTGIDVSTWERW